MAETKKSAKKKAPAKRSAPQPKYIRNIRYVPIACRLGVDKRRIELAARGQRGDMVPLKKGDLEDDIFIKNDGLLFEVISGAEAKKILEQQTTNQQTQKAHPALAQIRNPLGEEYEQDAVKTKAEPEFNSQGVTVADLTESEGGEGSNYDIAIDRRTGIRRAAVPGSEDNPSPESSQMLTATIEPVQSTEE